MTNASEITLTGTPYLTQGDAASERRFNAVATRASEVRDHAIRTHSRISSEAAAILAPYRIAIRSDLVAESNRIEGYDWSSRQVREVIQTHRELLNAPIGSFMSAVRDDERVYQALGLYRAHALADEWAASDRLPREYEIRALHELITAGEPYSGRYKSSGNKIAGTHHKTTEPWDVPRAMSELCAWWAGSSSDPALRATVVHAWLTHIHPFEDGNGRMARVLANLALIQAGFPPFLIRSASDRGQYYDALAASDDGDILPLYDLMVSVLRRTVRMMASPGYVRDIVHDRLLTDDGTQRELWLLIAREFTAALDAALWPYGWHVEEQGYPDPWSFYLLTKRDPAGNSWYLKVFDDAGQSQWLLWYGYQSDTLRDLEGGRITFPSIFTSIRDDNPESIHPYRRIFSHVGDIPDEITFGLLEQKPVNGRWGYETETSSIQDAATQLARALVEHT